jgi:hypothetical protein
MAANVIYGGRRHVWGQTSCMAADVIYGGRRHLWGQTSSMAANVIYGDRRHLWGQTSPLGTDVIYGDRRHLWRQTSSMADTFANYVPKKKKPPGNALLDGFRVCRGLGGGGRGKRAPAAVVDEEISGPPARSSTVRQRGPHARLTAPCCRALPPPVSPRERGRHAPRASRAELRRAHRVSFRMGAA